MQAQTDSSQPAQPSPQTLAVEHSVIDESSISQFRSVLPPVKRNNPSLPQQAPAATPTPAPITYSTPVTGSPTPVPSSRLAQLSEEFGVSRVQPLVGPTPTPVPTCQRVHQFYCIYTVRPGDTLSHVASYFNLNTGWLPGWELVAASNKPDITSIDDFIQPGQRLQVPVRPGIVHSIILDETMKGLADQFDVPVEEIAAANGIAVDAPLPSGQILFIPNPKRLVPPPPPIPPTPTLPVVPKFIWPLNSTIRITSQFGPRHPLGIDFGLYHDPKASINAVEAGNVTFAGGNACCSYGLYVIVDHGGGLKTLYAHLSRIDVVQGQRVGKGQSLGMAGSTGYSTGVHLHFEVHQGSQRVNPMNHLPK